MKSLKSLLGNNQFAGSKKLSGHRKDADKSDIFDFLELVNRWHEVVGPRLVENTIPLKLLNKNLTVLTSHPVFAQQLSYMEVVIIKKIEDLFPALDRQIKKIYFQADNKHFHEKRKNIKIKEESKKEFDQKIHKQSPQYKKLVANADQLFTEIQDQELKESLTSLFVQIALKK